MIFVTVGSQMSFDRLVREVDTWAGRHGRKDVFAQIGDGAEPSNIPWVRSLTSEEFRKRVEDADLVISHAGMGTILTALEIGKPILVLPRKGQLGETRNDHQVDTARKLAERGLVSVAYEIGELREKLDHLDAVRAASRISAHADPALLETVAKFLEGPVVSKEASRSFDGIVCFGGVDWWYHNRGHYDLQMMREFSRHVPVLYINSIGMRTPRIGRGSKFFHRVARKLKSLSRGHVEVRKNFLVLSPLSIPFLWSLSRTTILRSVRKAIARMGMRQPLLWIACPPGADFVDDIPHRSLVYQRTDKFETYPDVDPERIRAFDIDMKRRADVTLFCSSSLQAAEKDECRRSLFADHGVDFDRFATARSEPEDVRDIPRPRVGFVGGIDSHTFDPELFRNVVKQLPDVSFVLVGACSLPEGWCPFPNVHLLGQRPYESVADYMASSDVLIMPWNQNSWIESCNPVKLKEYLAVGRPVVTTPFGELARYDGHVEIARGADEFAARIRACLASPPDRHRLRQRVENETWTAKADLVLDALRKNEIVPAPVTAV
jgi:UDP-N-acetylglucosamine transferase subunit ALG13/glycosyltransferase involved in cell wall biosynthesis